MPLSFASGRLLASQRIACFHDGFDCTANLAARTPRPGEDEGPTSLLPPGHDGRHLIPGAARALLDRIKLHTRHGVMDFRAFSV